MKNITLLSRFLLISALILSNLNINAQSIIYVDNSASGIGNGTSWSSPYINLQTAIDSAKSGDTIWVTKGTYKPTRSISTSSVDPRDKAFQLKSGVCIYGSFNGTETSLSQRSFSLTSQTILSGDIGITADSSDNAYHVIVAVSVSNIALDGLSIKYGNADDTSSVAFNNRILKRSLGGGMTMDSSSAIKMDSIVITENYATVGGAGINIKDCDSISIYTSLFTANRIDGGSFTGGSGDGGGGLRNDNSNPIISSVYFQNNNCISCQGGGAMRNIYSNPIIDSSYFGNNYVNGDDGGGAVYNLYSDPEFLNVFFDSNYTLQEGGAVYSDNSNPIFTDVYFSENSCGSAGGGAMENDAGTASFTNVTFYANISAGDGGAIQNWKSNIILTDVVFQDNQANGDGGAILNYSNSSPTMNRVTFEGNSATGNGGAIYNERGSSPIITNTLIHSNYSGNKGGGIYTKAGAAACSPIFTNVTITQNRADSSGGGGYDDGAGNTKLRNSIVYGNTSLVNEDVDAPLSLVATALSHSIIGNNRYTTGLAVPTTFSSIHFKDSLNGDFSLDTLSPAIDNGDSSVYNATATPDISGINTDYRGADRRIGNNVDIGAFEKCNDFFVTVTLSSIDTGNRIVFTAISNALNPIYRWYIDRGNGPFLLSGENGFIYAPIKGVDIFNNYIVSVKVIDDTTITCGGLGQANDSIQVSITDIKEIKQNENKFSIYPNPNKGTFILEYNSVNKGVVTYTISDITGKELYRENDQNTNLQFRKAFNVTLSSGLYFFTITNDKSEKESVKLIVR